MELIKDERRILNFVSWAVKDQNAQDLSRKLSVELNNQVLEHMSRTLQKRLDLAMIVYPSGLLAADSNHRWGLTAFHFTRAFYVHFLKQLRVILLEC